MAIKAGQLKERADYQAYILEILEKENGYQVRPSTAYDPGYHPFGYPGGGSSGGSV